MVVSRLDIYYIRYGGRVWRRVNGVLYRGERAGSVLRHNAVEHVVVGMKLGGQHRETGNEKPYCHEVFHISFAFVKSLYYSCLEVTLSEFEDYIIY